jgi:hypothetical protein
LVYVSAASAPFAPSELTALLRTARANNQHLAVTGMLIYHLGSFMQTLEGAEAIVQNLFARIERDKRHHRVVVLNRADNPERAFGDWSMGFVDSTLALREVPGFNDFFRQGIQNADHVASAVRATSLMQAFREGRFRQFVAS